MCLQVAVVSMAAAENMGQSRTTARVIESTSVQSERAPHGFSADKIEDLKERKIITDAIEGVIPSDCDVLNMIEKALLADVVVVGTVVSRVYLYKEGGRSGRSTSLMLSQL